MQNVFQSCQTWKIREHSIRYLSIGAESYLTFVGLMTTKIEIDRCIVPGPNARTYTNIRMDCIFAFLTCKMSCNICIKIFVNGHWPNRCGRITGFQKSKWLMVLYFIYLCGYTVTSKGERCSKWEKNVVVSTVCTI